MDIIDLRSDTVTKPTPGMRKAMYEAEVGDDVYGEDPTVNRLETMTAERLGHEAGLFAPSGTQTNLLALLTHCQRGDEYTVGQLAHTYKYEGGGAAVLGGIQPQPIDFQPDGTLDLTKVERVLKPDDYHFARSRLLCLENTQGGKVLPSSYLEAARSFATHHGLGLHLDGARVFNAAVKQKVPAAHIGRQFDSVSTCLSKGLGSPVGSVLVGEKHFIREARRWRKVVGGGMRQAGVLAAAGIYALENNIERLNEDHDNARLLCEGLSAISEITIDPSLVQTNMVFAEIPQQHLTGLVEYLATQNVKVDNATPMRLVTHLDITTKQIKKVVTCVQDFFN